jgi:hypothetical protein
VLAVATPGAVASAVSRMNTRRKVATMSNGDEITPEAYESEADVVVTPHAVVITLTPEQRERAAGCLERSQAISFEIRAVPVTDLEGPSVKRAVVAID